MRNLRSNLGFTAVEVVIGVGLMAMLTLMVVTTQLLVSKQQIEMTRKLDDSIDTNLAERIIFMDLNGIEPSYNNITLLDDGKDGGGFYDYYPDVPSNILKSRETREIVLSLKGKKEFYALVNDNVVGNLMVYDPVAAYHVGAAPANYNLSAVLQYDSLNRNNWVGNQRPGFWVNGRLLMLDTPARLRPTNNEGVVDLRVIPRSPIYIGTVQGQTLTSLASSVNIFNTRHPETNADITTPDIFLRTAPSIGGGQPIVRLRAVRLVRYFIEPYTDERLQGVTPARLFKSNYDNGKWSEPMLLVDSIDEVVFKRESVFKKMIHFKINKITR